MTLKVFKKRLAEIIDKSDTFGTWSNKDEHFKNLPDDILVVVGGHANETFYLQLVKVK